MSPARAKDRKDQTWKKARVVPPRRPWCSHRGRALDRWAPPARQRWRSDSALREPLLSTSSDSWMHKLVTTKNIFRSHAQRVGKDEESVSESSLSQVKSSQV